MQETIVILACILCSKEFPISHCVKISHKRYSVRWRDLRAHSEYVRALMYECRRISIKDVNTFAFVSFLFSFERSNGACICTLDFAMQKGRGFYTQMHIHRAWKEFPRRYSSSSAYVYESLFKFNLPPIKTVPRGYDCLKFVLLYREKSSSTG